MWSIDASSTLENMPSKFTQLRIKLNEIALLTQISQLLDWDQQVNLPPKAGVGRAEQLEYLASAIHKKMTDDELRDGAQSCALDPTLNDDQRLVVSELLRAVDRQRRLPPAFVAEKARVSSETFQLWQTHKPNGDWRAIEGPFQRLVEIFQEEGTLLAAGELTPYNALLDVHERGATVEQLSPLFLRLGDRLAELTRYITERNRDITYESCSLPVAAQSRISRELARRIGYDFSRGALHEAAHPFMTSLGADDFRITTHFYPDTPLSSIFSTLHEVGHALYEQGLPSEWHGTARGAPISLGIHESQSRFWENIVGRSRPFMKWIAQSFAQEGIQVSEQELWNTANHVAPSLIRIEADEVTYSLHVIIRMMLESALIGGTLTVADLPAAWNEMYRKYLGITPPNHSVGVLQDVHWYCGLMGYFPTYVLGNLYGAILRRSLEREHGALEELIEQGEFRTILGWLHTNVHQHGMKFQARALIERISGGPFSEEPFITYLESKFEVS